DRRTKLVSDLGPVGLGRLAEAVEVGADVAPGLAGGRDALGEGLRGVVVHVLPRLGELPVQPGEPLPCLSTVLLAAVPGPGAGGLARRVLGGVAHVADRVAHLVTRGVRSVPDVVGALAYRIARAVGRGIHAATGV